MDLSEFAEELGDVLFHKFFDEGYETVRDVIESPKETIISALGIEPEKIDEIVTMLKKGLEEAEVENEEDGVAVAEPKTVPVAEAVTEPVTESVPAEKTEPSPELTPEPTPEPTSDAPQEHGE